MGTFVRMASSITDYRLMMETNFRLLISDSYLVPITDFQLQQTNGSLFAEYQSPFAECTVMALPISPKLECRKSPFRSKFVSSL
jgi:hypothetical protein